MHKDIYYDNVEVPAAFSISGSWHLHIDPYWNGQAARKTTTTFEDLNQLPPRGKGCACRLLHRLQRYCSYVYLVYTSTTTIKKRYLCFVYTLSLYLNSMQWVQIIESKGRTPGAIPPWLHRLNETLWHQCEDAGTAIWCAQIVYSAGPWSPQCALNTNLSKQ